MNRNQHKAIGGFMAIGSFFLTAITLFYSWCLLGIWSGVLSMCVSASEGWTRFYLAMGLLIPVCAIAAGYWAYHWYGQSLTLEDE